MRKIFNMAGLLAVILFTAGCRDTGHDVSVKPTFDIVNADVNFPASGGEGTIAIKPLKSGTPIITVDKDWCAASFSGNTINITVEPNSESFSRGTALTVTMDGYTRTFGIYQNGIYFYFEEDFGQLGYKKDDELRIPIKREGLMELEVSGCSEWVSTRMDGDEIIVTALERNGFDERTGFVTLKAGVQEKTLNFVQSKYNLGYSDFLGEWTFTYMYAPTGSDQRSLNVVLSASEDEKTIICTGLSTYTLIFEYDKEKGHLIYRVRDKVGTYTTGGVTYDVTIAMLTATGSYSATSTTLYSYANYEMVDSKIVLTFVASNASYSGGFGFCYLNGTTLVGWRAAYYGPVVLTQK